MAHLAGNRAPTNIPFTVNETRRPFATAPAPAPDGTLTVTITYLEMLKPPPAARRRARLEKLAIFRARHPTVPFYRYLYNNVGEPWLWYERRALSDDELATIITDNQVHLYVLYRDGAPAGFVELDRRVANEVELAYFGLLPQYIGKGLGPWLLGWAVETAWRNQPSRIWVNTCTLDHPKAIIVYQRAGFSPYRQETRTIRDPRAEPSWQSQHAP